MVFRRVLSENSICRRYTVLEGPCSVAQGYNLDYILCIFFPYAVNTKKIHKKGHFFGAHQSPTRSPTYLVSQVAPMTTPVPLVIG